MGAAPSCNRACSRDRYGCVPLNAWMPRNNAQVHGHAECTRLRGAKRNPFPARSFSHTCHCSCESRSNASLPTMSGQLIVNRPSVNRLLASLRELRNACDPKQEASEEPLTPAEATEFLDLLEEQVCRFIRRGWRDKVLDGLAEVYEDVAASVTFIPTLEPFTPKQKCEAINRVLVSPHACVTQLTLLTHLVWIISSNCGIPLSFWTMNIVAFL